jgi:cell division protein FtsB
MSITNKKNNKKMIYSWPVFIVLSLLVIFLINSNIKIYKKVKESAERKELIENQLIELKNRRLEIEKDVSRLDSLVGQEEELRNRLNVIKEGEKMIMIVDEEIELINQELEIEKEQSFWDKIKSFFSE